MLADEEGLASELWPAELYSAATVSNALGGRGAFCLALRLNKKTAQRRSLF